MLDVSKLEFTEHWYWNEPVCYIHPYCAVFQNGTSLCALFERVCELEGDCKSCQLLNDYCTQE